MYIHKHEITEINFTQIKHQNYTSIIFPSLCYSTKNCGKCYYHNQNYTGTQNASFVMNEMLWNATNKASSLALINQIDP